MQEANRRPSTGLADTRWIRHVPNALTVLRLLLAAAFPFVPPAARLATALAAGLSDAADGWIARRFRAQSQIGALLDGLADKLFVLSVLGTLLVHGEVAAWQVAMVLARDVVVAASFAFALMHERILTLAHADARLSGKFTTAFVFSWFACLLWAPLRPLAPWTFAAAAAASLWAAAEYAHRAWQAFRARRTSPGPP